MQRQDQAEAFVLVEMQPTANAIRIAHDALSCEQNTLGLTGRSGRIQNDPGGLFLDGVAAPLRFRVCGLMYLARKKAVRGRNWKFPCDFPF